MLSLACLVTILALQTSAQSCCALTYTNLAYTTTSTRTYDTVYGYSTVLLTVPTSTATVTVCAPTLQPRAALPRAVASEDADRKAKNCSCYTATVTRRTVSYAATRYDRSTQIVATTTLRGPAATKTVTTSGTVQTPALFKLQDVDKRFPPPDTAFNGYCVHGDGVRRLGLRDECDEDALSFKLVGSKLIAVFEEFQDFPDSDLLQLVNTFNGTVSRPYDADLVFSRSEKDPTNLSCSIDCLNRLQCSSGEATNWAGYYLLRLQEKGAADLFNLKILPETRRLRVKPETLPTATIVATNPATTTPAKFLLQVDEPENNSSAKRTGFFSENYLSPGSEDDRSYAVGVLAKYAERFGLDGQRLFQYSKGLFDYLTCVGPPERITCDYVADTDLACYVNSDNYLRCAIGNATQWYWDGKFKSRVYLGSQARKGFRPFEWRVVPCC